MQPRLSKRMAEIAVALLAAIWLAWSYRYEPILGGQVWDRWRHRVCSMESISKGYGCKFEGLQAELDAEKAALDQKIEIAKSAFPKLKEFSANLVRETGIESTRNFRQAGFSEKEIADWVMKTRRNLLDAGAPKAEVDKYFGGDPYLKP